jgi:hypothetical protein
LFFLDFIQEKDGQEKDQIAGPVKFNIEGNSEHLFEKEDFEKKEAQLLRSDSSTVELPVEDTTISSTPSNELGILVFTAPKRPKPPPPRPPHPDCSRANLTLNDSESRQTNVVQLINGTRLTQMLSESLEFDCFLVLFYVPWCPFSARLAPIYNALPRAFPNLDILAFDISKSFGYILRIIMLN